VPAPARILGPDALVAAGQPALDPGALPTLAELGAAAVTRDPRALCWPEGGERAGCARMEQWIWAGDHLRRYKSTRDGMLNVDDASRLSPWLTIGALSPRRVWAEVQRYERTRVRNQDTYSLIFELLWRDYFRFVMGRWGDVLFSAGGLQRLPIPWRNLADAKAREDFARWTAPRDICGHWWPLAYLKK
jgi:deoxyribodipyrimidine photo-lyase